MVLWTTLTSKQQAIYYCVQSYTLSIAYEIIMMLSLVVC